MIYYFRLFNRHKTLSLKRTSDYRRNVIIAILAIIFPMLFLTLLLAATPKEDIKTFSAFLVPAIILLDFSLRFFLKKNTDAAIVPYLTLPISRKVLIGYIVLSDLLIFWIWFCGLIYSLILAYCGVLTLWNILLVLGFVLLNNYFIAFVKAGMGVYSFFIYPVCLGFIFLMLLIGNLLNPILAFTVLVCAVFVTGMALFFMLKENLYTELNRIAL